MPRQRVFEKMEQEDGRQREAAAMIGLAVLGNLGPEQVRKILQAADPTLTRTAANEYVARAGKLLDRYHEYLQGQ